MEGRGITQFAFHLGERDCACPIARNSIIKWMSSEKKYTLYISPPKEQQSETSNVQKSSSNCRFIPDIFSNSSPIQRYKNKLVLQSL